MKTIDVQRALGASLRADAKAAAGDDGRVQPRERKKLGELNLESARKLGRTTHDVDDIVDHAMSSSMAVWARHNQPSGSGKATLSKAELARIEADSPKVGRATRAAVEKLEKPVAVPEVSLLNPPPGASLTAQGESFTVKLGANVPVGAVFQISIDGHPFELKRAPNAIASTFTAPEGCGFELVSRTYGAGDLEAVYRITKDPPGSLTQQKALEKAKSGLVKHIKSTRMKENDWKEYFASRWSDLVSAGVMAGIEKFGDAQDPGTQIERKPDRFVFCGRGPFDLYTEVEVAKRGGKILRVLIEID
ncbi:MAG: hypothetical protein HYV07_02625 [Deltaproteobacteria bacterium]|nr:hypothetical protein [Deltaproteobacteria bacterium]